MAIEDLQGHAATAGMTPFDGAQGQLATSAAAGWAGLTDVKFVLGSLAILLLAAILGALIGFHPASRRSIDQLHEADMPHVYVMYAVIGAVIGVAVHEFGTVVGVVVFGIGGLIRFKSSADSTRDTVRLIAVTLAGLIAGLGLLHFAILTTLFFFVLIWVFDTSPACRIRVEGLPHERAQDCADAYRAVLKGQRCRMIAEHHSVEKKRIEFVFRLPRRHKREHLDASLRAIAADLRGQVDWEVS
jgi:hypothetical protein